VRTTKGGENFFRHLRTFLGRFPGFKDEGHLECAFATYLLSQREKTRVGRDTPYHFNGFPLTTTIYSAIKKKKHNIWR